MKDLPRDLDRFNQIGYRVGANPFLPLQDVNFCTTDPTRWWQAELRSNPWWTSPN